LETLVDNLPDVAFVKDRDYRYALVNKPFCAFLGKRKDEVLGKTAQDLYPKDVADISEESDEKVFELGVAVDSRERERPDAQGVARILQTRKAPLKDAEGNITHLIGISRDITERKRMEETLRKSEEKFRLLLESSMYSVSVSVGTKLVYVNKRCAEQLGFSDPSQLIGRDFTEFIAPEDREMVKTRTLRRERGGPEPPLYEFKIQKKDGTKIPVETHAAAIEYEGKRATLSFRRDITDRKRMEEQYKTIIGTALDGFWRADISGHFLDVNDAYSDMIGYSRAELLTMRIQDVEVKESAEETAEHIRRIVATGSDRFETRHQRKDGQIIDIEVSVNWLPGKGGQLFVFLRQITERKKMEEELKRHSEQLEELVEERAGELKRSEEKFRRIYNASLNAIYTSSLEGRMIDVNPAAVSMFGYDSLDELGKVNVQSLYVNSDDRNKFIKFASEGPVRNFETQLRRKDGTVFDAIINSYSLKDDKDRITGFQGAIMDVTERKELERMRDQLTRTLLQDAARRKELEMMRDQFISAVTHELRTPLVSIKGYVDLVLDGSQSIPEEVESNLQVVKRNTDRLLSLVNDLLDLSRMQSGRLQLNLQSMDLRQIIDDCAAEIQPFVNAKKQSLSLEVPAGPLPVQGDPVRLSQVLANLLSNASKFAQEAGQIGLRVKDVRDVVVVQVSDNGIGIRKQDLERVFQPFAAIEKPTYVKGTGLGLSVSKGLVEAHGGKIWAESPGEGKGVTFTFTLPKNSADHLLAQPSCTPPLPTHR
ncbi:PAS domain S-box protein, partial [Candidatus Bathyarchaeota archaeon]|nr:PAS domain S-box protein [Candidatus Bathyarchaeota archaeon]